MGRAKITQRQWFVNASPGIARIRCSYRRRGNRIDQFLAQLEISLENDWVGVVRYDNAHGFCHRDILHPDGTQEKTRLFRADTNEIFTYAVEELKTNWQSHRARY
jgi:hypothetical protein